MYYLIDIQNIDSGFNLQLSMRKFQLLDGILRIYGLSRRKSAISYN